MKHPATLFAKTTQAIVVCIALFSISSVCRAGEWLSGAPMLSKRTEVAVTSIGSKIFVVGGFGGGKALEIYDAVTDRWQRAAPLPIPVHHAGAAA